MTSASMLRLMTVTASTKRASVASGKRATPSANLSSVKCTPLDPLGSNNDISQRLGLDAPVELLETWTAGGQDIVNGDTLTVSGVDYPIKLVEIVAASSVGGDPYLHLVVERVKP